MLKKLQAHPLRSFFVLTFLLSWLIWVPMALDHFSLLPFKINEGLVMIGRLLGTLGPAVSAILVSSLIGGKRQVKALLGQIGRWRVRWTWYAAAGLVFPALIFIVARIYLFLPGAQPLPFQQVSPGSLLVTMIILTISVMGEEIGWRGFALPRMQENWTALKSSLVLGTIWTIWHLPFWVVLGELEQFGAGYWILSWAWITAGSIYITWLMNNTGNSLLMALLFHWSYNLVSVGYLPITTVIPAYIIFIIFAWAIVLGLLSIFGPQRLSKSQAIPGIQAVQ
jgi:uncharacterized protein